MSDSTPNAKSFYAGLATATAATLALEIIQTRMLSVVSWYHLAFFVISVAMFGMTLGALAVFLRPAWFAGRTLSANLARFAIFSSVAVAVAYLDQISLAPEMVMSASAVVVFARLAVTVSVPFVFSGVVVTLALTRSPHPVAKTYGWDLAGAAAGCLGVIPLLGLLDGPGAIFACAALFAVSAYLFIGGESRRVRRTAVALAVAWSAVAVANTLTYSGLDPIMVKGQAEKRHWVAYERWNSFSRIVAYKPWNESPTVVMWAPSDKTPTAPSEYVMMNIDGLAGTAIFKMTGGDPASVDFLKYDVTTLAHHLRKGDAAIVGVGGGRDVAAALALGQRSVLGVELNPAFVDALAGPYREFAGLADHPGVRLVADEARSFFTRDEGRYDVIQASLIDTWAATGAGAYSLSENSIYTVEAWDVFLDRLAPRGVFTVSRWYAPDRIDETARLVSLAAGALHKRGVHDARAHILLAAHKQVATILVSNDAFSDADVRAFEALVADMGFKVLLAPGSEPASEWLEKLTAAPNYRQLDELGASAPLDLTPPTDEKPFFFNLLRLSRPWEIAGYLGRPSGVVAGNMIATLTLLTIVVVTLGLAAATMIVPRRLAPAGSRPPGLSTMAYFALIGFGFMLSEIAFLQRLSVYLGHPVYALAVVLFSLILFTGLGSFVHDRLGLTSGLRIALLFIALPAYLYWSAVSMPAFLSAAQGFGLFGRALLAVAFLAPAGLLMGQAFPLGMTLARKRAGYAGNDPTPWLWGVNGAAGVAAGALAVVISIAFGITATMLAGAACYAAILLTLPRLARADRGQSL